MCAMQRQSKDVSILISNKPENRTRKKRIVKNGYIDVDNVTISAGYLYSEWIRLSKEKLLEREDALMKIRINKIQAMVNKEIEKLKDINRYFISETTLSLVQNAISNAIGSWNGVDLNKKISSKPYGKFREYFNVAKNWWDQKKTNILGQSLWDPVLIELQQFVKDLFGDDDNILLWQILNALFHETVKYPNTKQQPLIPNGVIKNCKQVHQFFFGLNKKINIGSWLRQEIILEKELDAKCNQMKKRTGNAKIIAQTLRRMLTQLANSDNIRENVKIKDIISDEQRFKALKQESPKSVSSSPTVSLVNDVNDVNVMETLNNNDDNDYKMKSEYKATKTTSAVLPTMNPKAISVQSPIQSKMNNINYNLKQENIRYNPINNSLKVNNPHCPQTPDYNQIIFALADQFMINKNINNTSIPNNILLNNNSNMIPIPIIPTSMIPVPNIPIIPISGQSNNGRIYVPHQLINPVPNGVSYALSPNINHHTMGYNAVHFGSHQYEVSNQRFNPMKGLNNNKGVNNMNT